MVTVNHHFARKGAEAGDAGGGHALGNKRSFFFTVIDAVLQFKATRAAELGATLDIDVQLPGSLPVESTDLCSVFSNLLDNALEACEKLPEGATRAISLTALTRKGCLYVETRNPVAGVSGVLGMGAAGSLKTAKEQPERHGIGTQILADIARKYHGTSEFVVEEGSFVAWWFRVWLTDRRTKQYCHSGRCRRNLA